METIPVSRGGTQARRGEVTCRGHTASNRGFRPQLPRRPLSTSPRQLCIDTLFPRKQDNSNPVPTEVILRML